MGPTEDARWKLLAEGAILGSSPNLDGTARARIYGSYRQVLVVVVALSFSVFNHSELYMRSIINVTSLLLLFPTMA
jgi:hypothetical protein